MPATKFITSDHSTVIHYRITVDLYHDMLARGDIGNGAPYELLDGQMVGKDRSAAGEDPVSGCPRHVVFCARLDQLVKRSYEERL